LIKPLQDQTLDIQKQNTKLKEEIVSVIFSDNGEKLIEKLTNRFIRDILKD
jgi:hypothetical protein